mmetsp:Transcript_88463/g.249320  ORF Transcript_88463/g.249320 Transcript_88463/m.249320 type:complete len:395 (+) Transcript_88463:1-1185(+)
MNYNGSLASHGSINRTAMLGCDVNGILATPCLSLEAPRRRSPNAEVPLLAPLSVPLAWHARRRLWAAGLLGWGLFGVGLVVAALVAFPAAPVWATPGAPHADRVLRRRKLAAQIAMQLLAETALASRACSEGPPGIDASGVGAVADDGGEGGSAESYPDWLAGTWDGTSQLFAIETPQGDALAGEAALRALSELGSPAALERYPLRFIKRDGRVVADLACNTRPLVRGFGGVGAAESVVWDPDGAEPGRIELRLRRPGGLAFRVYLRTSLNELLPMQRLVSGSRVFVANEFFYAETEAPAETTPVRCVSKFRRLAQGPDVQLLQRVEVYAPVGVVAEIPGTGAAFVLGDADRDLGAPVAKYKNRVHLAPAGAAPLSINPCDEPPPCGYPFNLPV